MIGNLISTLWKMPKSKTSWTIGGAGFIVSLVGAKLWDIPGLAGFFDSVAMSLPDSAPDGQTLFYALLTSALTPVISRIVTYLRDKERFEKAPKLTFLDPGKVGMVLLCGVLVLSGVACARNHMIETRPDGTVIETRTSECMWSADETIAMANVGITVAERAGQIYAELRSDTDMEPEERSYKERFLELLLAKIEAGDGSDVLIPSSGDAAVVAITP